MLVISEKKGGVRAGREGAVERGRDWTETSRASAILNFSNDVNSSKIGTCGQGKRVSAERGGGGRGKGT